MKATTSVEEGERDFVMGPEDGLRTRRSLRPTNTGPNPRRSPNPARFTIVSGPPFLLRVRNFVREGGGGGKTGSVVLFARLCAQGY